MKSKRKLVVSFVALAVVVSLAWAFPVQSAPVNPSVLYSAPISFEEGAVDLAVACNIANVSSQSRDVVIHVIDADGQVVLSEEASVPPGAVFGVEDGGSSNPAYCRFLVQGPPENFRASSCVVGSGEGCVEARP